VGGETIGWKTKFWLSFVVIMVVVVAIVSSQTNTSTDKNITHPHNANTNTYYVGADGHKITLYHNPNATDITCGQVIKFIKQDETDQIPYNDSTFTCGEYAETVQHNAENAGIRCGWVEILFVTTERHSCNVFNTTDRGLVFIDCTCADSIIPISTNTIYQQYRPIALDPNKTIDPLPYIQDYEIYW
jgi:hypothetical protein